MTGGSLHKRPVMSPFLYHDVFLAFLFNVAKDFLIIVNRWIDQYKHTHPHYLGLVYTGCITTCHWEMGSLCYMMKSLNGSIFRVTDHLCGEFTGHQWITNTKASEAEFDIFFDLCLNKLLSKQWWGWWFEMPSCSLWSCNHHGIWLYKLGRYLLNKHSNMMKE